MILRGELFTESPVYRGNARKTLFTRDDDGTHRLVSLAGEVAGTAQSLMDAFIGQSRNGRNIGLLNELWRRLYDFPMPDGLVTHVDCKLQDDSYPRDKFFDLRMGLKLDEDRWAAEAEANYKMETVFRHSVFDFEMDVDESILQQGDHQSRLYYLLRELREGRFWFGAGKSKGLGRLRLEIDWPFAEPESPPNVNPAANHLRITLSFDATNPVLVGWPWGKVEPDVPAFAAVEGRLLVEAMRDIPEPIRERLRMVIGGPILSPADWKRKLADYLPRVTAVWLQEQSSGEKDIWFLPKRAVQNLGQKKRYPLSKKVISAAEPVCDKPFPSREAAEEALVEALGNKANMADRIMNVIQHQVQEVQTLDHDAWMHVVNSLGLDPDLESRLAEHLDDEGKMTEFLAEGYAPTLPRLYEQVDQQIDLLQSDAWVDQEITNREEHLQIKQLLLDGTITEDQWGDRSRPPEGVSAAAWQSFLNEHSRVRFRYMTHPRNLRKSITNDRNFITFLQGYRDRARQELAQPYNVDFRAGGPSNRDVSRKYGKSYDTVFMRMLSWAPSSQEEGAWEIYVPGSTIKGAFRKRASQVLQTLWGNDRRTNDVLDRLFGTQGQRGAVFFSDAYLTDPHDPRRAWCSMDGVKMDPKTGRPVEAAKHDYLFAYGEHLNFQVRLDIQDITDDDLPALPVLYYLIEDFQRGDIPLGGEKTTGFGWVEASVDELVWLTGDPTGVSETLFGEQPLADDGIWHRLELEGDAAAGALQAIQPLVSEDKEVAQTPPRAGAGFVSHRAFGGYCGTLSVEAEILTPTHIQESGEPSHRATLDDGPVNGWDFFSMAPPEAEMRPAAKQYALPSRSIKGMLRHVYTIASDSHEPSRTVGDLNPVDGLFGWVGQGPNQAIAGRLSFSFGLFDDPELSWFKVPYPYGRWRFAGGEWKRVPEGSADQLLIANTWRLFPHVPLAPIVEPVSDFRPDTAQASYCRAIMPGSRAHFTIRFWNLEEEELQRLMWCVGLESGLAHKMGKHRYVGLGSLRLRVLPDSFLIDWASRYAGQPEDAWRLPLQPDEWTEPGAVANDSALRRALNAEQL